MLIIKPSSENVANLKLLLDIVGLDQRWATLFGSRATLVTNLVDAGQYKNRMYSFSLTFERKSVLVANFLIKSISRGIYFMFYEP